MSTPSTPPNDVIPPDAAPPTDPAPPRDSTYWAGQVTTLRAHGVPAGAFNLNVEGRRIVGPLQGFGPMWQKTYRVRLSGVTVTPATVIAAWKENFPTFWPRGARFYASLTGIAPGEVAILNLTVGGMRLSTGVLVLYADDESFTLMTPLGHMFAGWITFSAFEEDGGTVAQAQVLMRSNDPIYELGLRFGGHRSENRFWKHTLRALARHLGVAAPVVQTKAVCVDRRIQWGQARNIWQNAGVRTTMYIVATPARWIARPFRRRAR
jgi:hypothetical protein